MFTGKFAAGATALRGEGGEIDFDLIQGASLALSPQCFGTLAEVLPGFGVAELFASAGGTGIGREG